MRRASSSVTARSLACPSPVRERLRVARGRPQTHDASALGVDGDEQRDAPCRPAPARAGPRVSRASCGGVDDVAAEEQDAAGARLAQQPLEGGVGVGRRCR